MARPPIVVMSFDRPDYLRPVLLSLRDQVDCDLGDRELHFFQDGAFNPDSYRLYTSPETIQTCLDIAREIFPDITIHESPTNIGVARNRIGAERYIFEERGFDMAHFLEDDLVLLPHYINLVDNIMVRALDAPVAYASAYSRFFGPLEEQQARATEMIALSHIWGVALSGKAWRAMQPALEGYMKIVSQTDYRYRDHRKIYEYYASLGYGGRSTSQDSMHHVAAAHAGFVSYSTLTVHAKYIGAKGVHQYPARFNAAGYPTQVTYPAAPPELDFPDAARIAADLASARRKMASWVSSSMAEAIANLAPQRNPRTPNNADACHLLCAATGLDADWGTDRVLALGSLKTADEVVDTLIRMGRLSSQRSLVRGTAAAAPVPDQAVKTLTTLLTPGRRWLRDDIARMSKLGSVKDVINELVETPDFKAREQYVLNTTLQLY